LGRRPAAGGGRCSGPGPSAAGAAAAGDKKYEIYK